MILIQPFIGLLLHQPVDVSNPAITSGTLTAKMGSWIKLDQCPIKFKTGFITNLDDINGLGRIINRSVKDHKITTEILALISMHVFQHSNQMQCDFEYLFRHFLTYWIDAWNKKIIQTSASSLEIAQDKECKRLLFTIRSISFYGFALDYIPVQALEYFWNLEKIAFKNMKLCDEWIERIESMKELGNLKILLLSGNKFTQLPYFSEFRQLTYVNLSNNKIKNLSIQRYQDGALLHRSCVEHIVLVDNPIKVVENEFFTAFPKLKTLRFSRDQDISMAGLSPENRSKIVFQ